MTSYTKIIDPHRFIAAHVFNGQCASYLDTMGVNGNHARSYGPKTIEGLLCLNEFFDLPKDSNPPTLYVYEECVYDHVKQCHYHFDHGQLDYPDLTLAGIPKDIADSVEWTSKFLLTSRIPESLREQLIEQGIITSPLILGCPAT